MPLSILIQYNRRGLTISTIRVRTPTTRGLAFRRSSTTATASTRRITIIIQDAPSTLAQQSQGYTTKCRQQGISAVHPRVFSICTKKPSTRCCTLTCGIFCHASNRARLRDSPPSPSPGRSATLLSEHKRTRQISTRVHAVHIPYSLLTKGIARRFAEQRRSHTSYSTSAHEDRRQHSN